MKSKSFIIYFGIFVVGSIVMKYLDATPPGIIAFELAKTIENANAMVASWDSQGVLSFKKFSLYFDFIYMIGYGGSLFFVLKEWGIKSDMLWVYYLKYLPIMAVLLDVIENLALFKIVYLTGTQFHASVSFYCASAKFIILFPCVLASLYYMLTNFLRKV